MVKESDYFLRYSPRGSVAPVRENIESMSDDRSRDKLWRHGPDPLFRRLLDEAEQIEDIGRLIQYTRDNLNVLIWGC